MWKDLLVRGEKNMKLSVLGALMQGRDFMPMRKELYPDNWNEIASRIKRRAGWQCEKCGIAHNKYIRGHVLTVHHKDCNPANNSDGNLIALCAECHLREHARIRARIEKKKKNDGLRQAYGSTMPLFPDSENQMSASDVMKYKGDL